MNLNELEKKLLYSLEKETPYSLKKWFFNKRNKNNNNIGELSMKQFWDYMESVREEKEFEIQNEMNFFGLDVVFITSFTEIIFWGLVTGATLVYLINKVKKWISEKLTIEAENKEIEKMTTSLLNDIGTENWESIQKMYKGLSLEEKRNFKRKIENNSDYKKALEDLKEDKNLTQAKATIAAWKALVNKELNSMPGYKNIKTNK